MTKTKLAHVWDRDPLDWYVENPWATRGLLSVERFEGAILDPACGQGNIVETCRGAGLYARGADIKRRTDEPWFLGEFDFWAPDFPIIAPNLISNPPFRRGVGTDQFIRLSIERGFRKIAIFTTLNFVASAGRATGLFYVHPPARIWVITPRPSCPPGESLLRGGKATGDTKDYVWLVWDADAPPAPGPIFGWISVPKSVRLGGD
jgi:hypothetical protein